MTVRSRPAPSFGMPRPRAAARPHRRRRGGGAGEKGAMPGGARLPMPHVAPGPARSRPPVRDPLHTPESGGQARRRAGGAAAAGGIRAAMGPERAADEYPGTSAARGTADTGPARMARNRANPGRPLRTASGPPYGPDMQRREPGAEKAGRMPGFEAEAGLRESLDEAIRWLRDRDRGGGGGMREPEEAAPAPARRPNGGRSA